MIQKRHSLQLFAAIALLSATLLGFKPSQNVNFTPELSSDFDSAEIVIIHKASEIFEQQLMKRYDVSEIEFAYRRFLSEHQSMQIPPNFFVTPETHAILQKMKTTGLFDKIWINESEVLPDDEIDVKIVSADGVETTEEDIEEPEEIYYCINPTGTFLSCLIKNNSDESVAEVLKAIKSSPGISPALTALVVGNQLSEEDYQQNISKLIITFAFYYNMTIMIEE